MYRCCFLLLGMSAILQTSTARGDEPVSIKLKQGELTCVLGNEQDHGAGRTGYIGLWSLTSVHEPRNAFVPRYAGWIQQRQRATVKQISAAEGVVQHYDADGNETVRQTFELIAPYSFECTFSRASVALQSHSMERAT